MNSLAFLYITGQGVEQDDDKAKNLWMKIAALGDISAIINLKKLDNKEGKTTPSFTPAPSFCSNNI